MYRRVKSAIVTARRGYVCSCSDCDLDRIEPGERHTRLTVFLDAIPSREDHFGNEIGGHDGGVLVFRVKAGHRPPV